MKHLKLLFVGLFILSSCGSETGSGQKSDYNGQTGAIKAVVNNSQSFNPNISHGQIGEYKITITGSGIEEPIEAIFDGSAEAGTVEGVPAGRDRFLKVEAINLNKVKIREGESISLEIKPNAVTEAEINLESVPIFANIADKGVIPNTRFKAIVFSEPGAPVTIEDEHDGVVLPVLDINAGETELMPDASTGTTSFLPVLLPDGEHKLTVKNVITGRQSSLTVYLTDGTKIKPAPFYSGSNITGVRLGMPTLSANFLGKE